MRISHLDHTPAGVYCKLCHAPFRLPGRVLSDPHWLVEAKERIAAQHVCGGVRAQRRYEAARPAIARPVCTESKVTYIDEHWNREIKRLFPAVGAAR